MKHWDVHVTCFTKVDLVPSNNLLPFTAVLAAAWTLCKSPGETTSHPVSSKTRCPRPFLTYPQLGMVGAMGALHDRGNPSLTDLRNVSQATIYREGQILVQVISSV